VQRISIQSKRRPPIVPVRRTLQFVIHARALITYEREQKQTGQRQNHAPTQVHPLIETSQRALVRVEFHLCHVTVSRANVLDRGAVYNLAVRILLLNLYYPPDTSATAKMAETVVKVLTNEHQVTLLCGRPSYDPTERRAWRWHQTEESRNLRI